MNRHLKAVRGLKLQRTTKAVLRALADQANDNDECWPKYATLAGDLGLHPLVVKRHVRQLEAAGLVQRIERLRSNGSTAGVTFRLIGAAAPEEGGTGDYPGGVTAGYPRRVTGGATPEAPVEAPVGSVSKIEDLRRGERMREGRNGGGAEPIPLTRRGSESSSNTSGPRRTGASGFGGRRDKVRSIDQRAQLDALAGRQPPTQRAS
jgi:hypothetical protein